MYYTGLKRMSQGSLFKRCESKFEFIGIFSAVIFITAAGTSSAASSRNLCRIFAIRAGFYILVFSFRNSHISRIELNSGATIDNKPLRGPTYLSCFERSGVQYEEITTILTKDEFEQLKKFCKEIDKIGCVSIRSESYKRAVKLCEEIHPVYDKLNSEENEKLFAQIAAEEATWLMKEYNLSKSDLEKIFEEYPEIYRDREVVSNVYDSVEECAKDRVHYFEYPEDDFEDFDYKSIGEYFLKKKCFVSDYASVALIKLADGRVANTVFDCIVTI
jgi:hypothetical protein